MNKEKVNKIYCPTIFGYGIVAIFLTQLNMLIHFQWAVPVFADVLSFLSAAALTGVACFDMTFKVQGANRKVFISASILSALFFLSAIANIEQIVTQNCGIPALVGNLVTSILAAFYAILHYRAEDVVTDSGKLKKRLSRGFAIGGAAFVFFCCVITPVMVTIGVRMGYPFEGCLIEQRCPVSYALPFASQKGTVETVEYELDFYSPDGNGTGQTVSKRAKVYLPYGYYDKENSQKRYDILYLSHGATYDENHFFGSDISKYKSFFDHMIEDGLIKPMIVVTPCLYTKVDEIDNAPDSDLTTSFQYELKNVLVPLIESKYRTYAENATAEGLEASRSHRAFGGYSMGSATTLRAFRYNLDYFSKFIPMSVGIDDIDDYIYAIEQRFGGKYQRDDFTLCLSTGGRDGAYDSMVKFYNDLCATPRYFLRGDSSGNGNFMMYVGTNHRHGSEFVMEYLYVYLPMLFGN